MDDVESLGQQHRVDSGDEERTKVFEMCLVCIGDSGDGGFDIAGMMRSAIKPPSVSSAAAEGEEGGLALRRQHLYPGPPSVHYIWCQSLVH